MPHVGGLTPQTPPPTSTGRGDAAPAAPGLRPGDVVEAEIVESRDRGEGVLRIGARLFRALYPEGLPKGARLLLRLVSAGPPMLFERAERADSALSRLLRPPGLNLGAAVEALLQGDAAPEGAGQELALAARLLNLPTEPEALAKALERWVLQSGTFHEAAMARGEAPEDLKSALLRLAAQLPEGSRLREAADALLGHLEAHQARSVLEGTLVVPLVLPWGEEPVQGELRLEEDGSAGKGERRGARVLRIRLHMPHLGPVEVGLRWGSAGISVRIAVEAPTLETARAHLGELADLLVRRAGVRLADLRAEPLPAVPPRAGPGLVEVVA